MTGKYANCSTVPRTFVHDCRFNLLLHTNRDINANVYLWEYSKCFHLLFEWYLAPHTDLPTPDKGESGDS